MARAAVILVLIVAIAYASAYPQQLEESQQCGPNEEFKTCGTPCEPKCGQETQKICTLRCMIGCQCKEGYVRNSENKCVLTRDC
ncbi:chymotrypsin inhibitor-like [Ceratina calcarata]|uniref:Chymotrypsin inhibitor-like n=1 Tax=Ceratina calcarata TaxID=156304 RepID=A0AAJ7JCG2_9HYME|nr:chymotrypsin inhibitor-like [Ceratina calcarata]